MALVKVSKEVAALGASGTVRKELDSFAGSHGGKSPSFEYLAKDRFGLFSKRTVNSKTNKPLTEQEKISAINQWFRRAINAVGPTVKAENGAMIANENSHAKAYEKISGLYKGILDNSAYKPQKGRKVQLVDSAALDKEFA